ncbi:MAG: hypothetical protein ACPL1K_00105 [Candidatus Kryptoniota bacterium]
MIYVNDQRSFQAIEREIIALRNLISRRMAWLSDPSNRLRGTWEAVSNDTINLQLKLTELEKEAQSLHQINL